MSLYLQGAASDDGKYIHCSLTSSTIMFVINYCQTTYDIVFVPDSKADTSMCCYLSRQMFSDHNVMFTSWTDVPHLVRNVLLPSLHQPELSLVRSGLCVLLRHIIKDSHSSAPHLQMLDLLGFRQGSMKMCSEVSGFTKLCEVELQQSVSHLMDTLRDSVSPLEDQGSSRIAHEIPVPNPLIKLDCHFQKKCRVHNDNKRRREEVARIKKLFAESLKSKTLVIENKIEPGNLTSEETLLPNHICGKNFSEHNNQLHFNGGFTSSKHSALINSGNESFRFEVQTLPQKGSWLHIEHIARLHHGIRRMTVDKHCVSSCDSTKGEGSLGKGVGQMEDVIEVKLGSTTHLGKGVGKMEDVKSGNTPHLGKGVGQMEHVIDVKSDNSTHLTQSDVLKDVAELIEKLSYVDISYEHTYSEGIEMTLADLILYVYVYHLLEALGFYCGSLTAHIASILHWASHMTSLGTVISAGQSLGWDMDSFATCLRAGTHNGTAGEDSHFVQQNERVVFIKEADVEEEEYGDEMELSRCAKMKHRALKLEVCHILQRFETAGIKPVTGDHCCGDCVEVDWDNLPAGVHPREGDVPDSRTHRKCQQLENLLTATQMMATPGNVVVDFCSGGGHLGILIAYLLPDCQVYLVENKEESLLKAISRLEVLALGNVTMYQCNLDYFGGVFDIGVSLHACGSATDMVLQLCLNSHASFVVCPCCYGSIQKTHLMNYPQSKQFTQAGVTYKDFLTVGHAADQTEVNIALEKTGRQCMNLVDTDRAQMAREFGYTVTLCSLKPLSCTPKNNLLIGAINSGWVCAQVQE